MGKPIAKGTKGDSFQSYDFSGGDLVVTTKKRFLEAMLLESVVGIVSLACDVTGTSKSYIYRLRNEDSEFEKAWLYARVAAKNIKADLCEAALVQLIKEKNATAVIFGLKKYNPEEFGDRPINTRSEPVSQELSPEYKEMLQRLMQKN